MLEFQIAMLEDDALTVPALEAIASGADAASAWSEALDAEIAGYLAAEDDYFRARSADLIDIRGRVLRLLSGARATEVPSGVVLFAKDMTPSQFLAVNWTQGGAIVLGEGSPASHVAMLARARGVPMIVGVGQLAASNDDVVLVDAEHGRVILDPDGPERDAFAVASTTFRDILAEATAALDKPAVTADGVPVEVLVNVAEPEDVDHIDVATCDGVGLMRTEFLFSNGLPDEETQYHAYRRVLEWAAGRPVTIRTVDAGGDKPVEGYTMEESNPFLGVRGLRLSRQRPDVFRVQVRALLRAAIHGNLKVMFPMVTRPEEVREASDLFAEEAAALVQQGVACAMPPLGIMVEVPAVAIAPDAFADVAFMSIGSNDLTQYVMAAARDNGAVAALNDVRHPAVLALIAGLVRFATTANVPLSLCGDAGSDPAVIPHLLRVGLRTLSVSPAHLPLAKAAIARTTIDG